MIEIKGKVLINGMEIPKIYGGFGDLKKCMLLKNISDLHGRKLEHLNQLVNNNRKRFIDGVDIIDLKADEKTAITLINSGIISQNAYNASKNIYILSERGYTKLAKLMTDDTSWEVFDALVDGYFEMKEEKESLNELVKVEPIKNNESEEIRLLKEKRLLMRQQKKNADFVYMLSRDKNLSKEQRANLIMKAASLVEDRSIDYIEYSPVSELLLADTIRSDGDE